MRSGFCSTCSPRQEGSQAKVKAPTRAWSLAQHQVQAVAQQQQQQVPPGPQRVPNRLLMMSKVGRTHDSTCIEATRDGW
jgi:hypothetical protein